jgi:hypothetical protein
MLPKSPKKVDKMDNTTSSLYASPHAPQAHEEHSETDTIQVVRLPRPPITIHQITEEELERLREGAPDSMYFSVALSACLAAVSIIATLLLQHPSFLLAVALFLFGVGIFSGIVCLRSSKVRSPQNPYKGDRSDY